MFRLVLVFTWVTKVYRGFCKKIGHREVTKNVELLGGEITLLFFSVTERATHSEWHEPSEAIRIRRIFLITYSVHQILIYEINVKLIERYMKHVPKVDSLQRSYFWLVFTYFIRSIGVYTLKVYVIHKKCCPDLFIWFYAFDDAPLKCSCKIHMENCSCWSCIFPQYRI